MAAGHAYNVFACVVPKPYCGTNAVVPPNAGRKKYRGRGTQVECLKQGFGAGYYSAERNHLPPQSLLRVPYINARMVTNFQNVPLPVPPRAGNPPFIGSLLDLEDYVLDVNNDGIVGPYLRTVCTTPRSGFSAKAFNSLCLYLYDAGIHPPALPPCVNFPAAGRGGGQGGRGGGAGPGGHGRGGGRGGGGRGGGRGGGSSSNESSQDFTSDSSEYSSSSESE